MKVHCSLQQIELIKKNDTIFLIAAVEEETPRAYMYGAILAMEVMEDIQNKKELAGRNLLHKLAKKLKEQHINNIRLLLGITNEVGDLIVNAISKHEIDICCIGRRGMGKLKRLFVGSVSSYVVQHASCDVFVVKGEHGPEEIHDVTPNTVKKIEEIERIRRIQVEQRENKEEEERRKFDSRINKNITVVSEETERRRRIQEEKEQLKKEEEQRIADKIGAVIDEEGERKRRIKEEKEQLKKEEEQRIAEKIGVVIDEEEERKRRIREEKEQFENEGEQRIANKIGAIIDEEQERKRRINEEGIVEEREHKVEIFRVND